MFGLLRPEYREPTYRLPDLLPWYGFIAPGVILQKNAVVQKTFAFRGHDLASSSPEQLITACGRLNNAIKRLGTGWSLFIETQRAEAAIIPSALWREPAAWLVDCERRQTCERAALQFETTHFATLAWQLPLDTTTAARNLFYDDPEGRAPNIAIERDLELFRRTAAELTDMMRGVFAEVVELDDSRTLTYLHSTISTNRHPVVPPEGAYFLDAILPDMPFSPGDIPMLGDHFIPTAVITHFPPSGCPAMLAAIEDLGFEYRVMVRFECLDKSDAQRELEAYRRTYWAGRKTMFKLFKEEAFKEESALVNNASGNKAADADAALQSLGEDLVAFGRVTITLTTWDTDLDLARQKMLALKRVIQSRGMVVRSETLNSRAAWLGSLPGHVYSNVRRPIVSTINLAHLFPISSVWAGDAHNEHLAELTGEKHAHIYCSTNGSTPFRLNLAVGDVGHALILGPTGAGKSTLLALLALQFLRYPHARVVLFDKDRSARAATLAVGGRIYEPANPAAPVAFQPLRNIDDPAERLWASQFVSSLLEAQLKRPAAPEIKAAIDRALELLAKREPRHRTLLNFGDALGSTTLNRALRPYTIQGDFGQIFDADADDLQDSSWMMFEMGPLMALGPEALIPALEYLFHRVERALDGRPTLIEIDECWRPLEHPTAAQRLKAWAKEFRKKNAYLVFATQDVADATSSTIMPTLLSACKTKIFLPNAEAESPLLRAGYESVGLSATEIAIVASAQPKRDYFYVSEKGRRLFSLDMGPVGLAFTAMSGEHHQQTLDDIEANTPPERYAEEILRRRGLSWAADLVAGARERLGTSPFLRS